MKRAWLLVLIAGCLIAGAGGIFGIRLWLSNSYQHGLQAYQTQNAPAAATQFARVVSFPPLLGDFVVQSQARAVEVEAYLRLQAYWEQGTDFPAAYAALQNFLKAYPDSAFAEIVKGEIAIYDSYQEAVALRQAQDYEAAIAACQEHLRRYPQSPFAEDCQTALQQMPFEWVEMLAARRRYAQAVQVLEDTLRQEGLPAEQQQKANMRRQKLLLEWAAYEGEMANYAQAEALYLQLQQEAGLKLDSELAKVYFAWAKQLTAAGEYGEAVAKYRLAAQLKELLPAVRDQAKGLADQTLLEWGAAQLESGDLAAAGEIYATLLAEGSPEASAKIPAQAAEALLIYGEARLSEGDLERAQPVFAYLEEHLPSESSLAGRCLLGVGKIALANGEYFQAAAAYQGALQQLKTPAEKAPVQAALNQALFSLSQVGLDQPTAKALTEIFTTMVVEEKKLNFSQKRCAQGLCFSPQELQVAHQAIGREADASRFYHFDGPDYLPTDQKAERLGHLRYAVKSSSDLVKLQTCRYGPPGTGITTNYLIRQRHRVTVEIYDLASGRKVATQQVNGSDPPACPAQRGFGAETEYETGSFPEPEDVFAVFRRYQKEIVFKRSLLKETFGDNSNRWPLAEDPAAGWRGSWQLSEGMLQASGAAEQAFRSVLLPGSLQTPLTNLMAQVLVKAPQAGGFYGLVLRASGKQFYAFVIDEQRQAMAFLLWTGEAWQELLPWKSAEILQKDAGTPRRLSVRLVGQHFWLYINDVLVGAVEDSTLPSGQVGLIMGSSGPLSAFGVQFDDLQIEVP